VIKAEIWSENRCTLFGPFPFPFIRLINSLAGRKNWDGLNSVKIEGTPSNLRILQESDYAIEFQDRIGQLTEMEKVQSMPTQHASAPDEPLDYNFNETPYDHQDKCIRLSWFREYYALLFDVGLGKTFIMIVTAGILFLRGKITGVLVLAPKGVHRQWIDEEIPRHMDKRIAWSGIVWKKKRITDWKLPAKKLTFFAMNTDAIRTKDGLASAKAFMKTHSGKVALFIDESHDFKNQASDRTRALNELGEMATYRRIATGTPQAKNVMDLFTQFEFLSPLILGCKYLSSFRARYCISGKDGRTVVAQKNTEELYSLIAPHSFRLTKEEAIDLPPKIYSVREYEMSNATRKHYDEMKKTLLTEMDDGTIVDGVNAAVGLLRLHQIVCGHLPGEGEMHRFGGERVEAMMDIVDLSTGPIVIWCRFIEDRAVITEALKKAGETFVVYEGNDNERSAARDAFLSGKARCFVSNPRSGGVGLNLQGHCQTVIFFSNSFNAVDRWQADGRTHRIGTLGTVTYFDLVATKSVDRSILRNLKNKKDLADLTLDEIRQAIISEE